MKSRKHLIVLLLSACWCVFLPVAGCRTAAADAAENSAGSPSDSLLAGLEGLAVQVQLHPADSFLFTKHGLSAPNLQQQIESHLKKASVPVVTAEKCSRIKGKPTFVVDLRIESADDSSFVAVHLQAQLRERARLLRNPARRAPATSYEYAVLKIRDASRLSELRRDVSALTSRFAREYAAANPLSPDRPKAMITGKVVYVPLEGGFFGLVADDGRKFDPMDMPEDFKTDGLRVRFRVREKTGVVGFHMWGRIVELLAIEKM